MASSRRGNDVAGWRTVVAALSIVVGVLLTPADASAAKTQLPNILVLLADDVDWRDFGCYGNDAVRTPNIDALARSGIRFRSAFLTSPQCSPTRISVLTGKYPHATGAEDLSTPLPAGQTFVTKHLQARGYLTGHLRKKHFGPNGDSQFEWYAWHLHDFPKFLDACGDRPFFMWVGFRDAHRDYVPGAVDPPHSPARVKVPPYLADTPETREDLALYYDAICRLDGNIGKMVAELEARGLRRDTLILFFGDNGMPFPRAKGTCYDSGIGTPMIVSWPGTLASGVVSDALVSVVDFAPTFLELAGGDAPAEMHGRSMWNVMKDLTLPGRRYVFSERNWHTCDEHIRSVRTRRYKLIRNAYLDVPHGTAADICESPSWQALYRLKQAGQLTPQQAQLFRVPRPRLELYDVERDPWEFENLADRPAHAATVQELEAALDEWIAKTGDFPPHHRRRADNTNRNTGVKFTKEIPPLIE